MDYAIKDINLAPAGRQKVDWAAREMKVLAHLAEKNAKSQPFRNIKIACCLHITSETANLVIALQTAGAEVLLTASNPLSTQDEVAAYLVKEHKIPVFGQKGETEKQYYQGIEYLLKARPHLLIDDGADLIAAFHKQSSYATNIMGATEETTTGVIRLVNLSQKKLLHFPVVAVNNAQTKHLFDNRYGTGQSAVDGILRATNILLAGKTAVVCGYGWCGRGIARRLAGMGSRVIVTEVNPLAGLEAIMDGFYVMPVSQAASRADIFVTATGDTSVLTMREISQMKDGAILANAGHFNVEVEVEALEKEAVKKTQIKPWVTQYLLPNGRKVCLLGEGRLVNLACAEGHPAAVMDMSFSNQFLALKYLREHPGLNAEVYPVPEEIDHQVAELKLKTMGVKLDKLSQTQKNYLASWNLGT